MLFRVSTPKSYSLLFQVGEINSVKHRSISFFRSLSAGLTSGLSSSYTGLSSIYKTTSQNRELTLNSRVFTIALCFSLSACFSLKTVTVSAAELEPTPEHREATAAILQLMQRYHYKRVSVDDELSEQIFDRFLDSLDPRKSFLLASDLEEFEDYQHTFDDAIRNARLAPVFEVFNRFRSRMEERADYAKGLLDNDFDFTIDESYTFDREELPWIESTKAMDDLWRKRVKNDVLSLRLTDVEEEEISDTLIERYERMEQRITQLKPNDVFQLFINAYTLSVEPHTSYFSPRNSEEFQIRMSLSLEGIGAALRTEDEHTVVQRIIAGGPAAMSELISADDRIVGVGEEGEEIIDIVSMPLSDVVDLIRGPKGSTVNLEILPAAASAGTPPTLISLVRDKIKLEESAAKSSIVEASLDGKTQRFGVIDLPTFYLDSAARNQGLPDYRSTTRDVQRLINEMVSADGGIDGVIMDLRGNGGGSLVEARDLTGIFIETGPVVQIRDSSGDVKLEIDQDPAVVYKGPLAVLVDRNSASASEIFAAAIQDYGRGVVMGEPTFGKGTVQSVVPLDREGMLGQLKVTIAQFFRVNGDGTQFRGVVPDITFPIAMDSDAQGERGLDNALPWAQVPAAKYKTWPVQTPDYTQAQNSHGTRYQANPSFELLLEELESQRTSRTQSEVSLVESVRRQEISEQETDRDERLELFRKAFGFSSNDQDDDEGSPDIILEEAANVLVDLLADLK